MVTSLTLVDGLWWRTVAICVGLGVLVLAFTVWSGLFFVRSIVRPLGEVEATATKIAKGDMKVRLPDTRYDDEIGRLCKTINQMAEDLAETERLKNEFISSVSHELRTPLTSIRGWVETISNIDDPTNENYRRGLSIIGTETDRLYTMVEELLDFSRLQNGIKMNCEVLDFVAEATDAALFVEARIRQEGMQLVYPELPEPYPVWADPARLRQVFVNLFDNAIKYSEPGGTIFLTLSRTPVTVSASIRDQGRGIAPDDLEKVKQKFFKAKNSVRGWASGWPSSMRSSARWAANLTSPPPLARAQPSPSPSPSTTPGRSICMTRFRRLPPWGKLSPKVTDEGRVCVRTALRFIARASPHPALRRHLPPRGKAENLTRRTIYVQRIPHLRRRPGPDGGHYDARAGEDLLRRAQAGRHHRPDL